MIRRDSLTLYLAYFIIFFCLIGMALLLWGFFHNRDGAATAMPTIAPLAVIPKTIMETAVSPTAAPTDIPATQPPAPQTHVIQAGDTLFSIAASYNLPLDELAAANHITDPNLIQVGQQLTIPGQFNTSSPPQLATSNPPPATLNGIPLDQIVIMPPNVIANTRAIYAKGQELGRNPHAFAKVGDSTVENDHFLSRFDAGPYNLGDYAYLQRVIDHFSGSFNRDSAAVRIGLHSWTVFDPIWADKAVCGPNETVIACEFRLHNPSIVLIRLGSNDSGAPGLYDESMRQIVQYAIDNGVIPIIGAKADRNEGSNQNNDIMRQISADYQIPLWDFDLVAGTLPGRGLDVDNVHMNTFYAHDYTDSTAFTRGHAMHNLTALMTLDAMLNEVINAGGE